MFLHLSVSHSVHGGCLPQCMLGYTPLVQTHPMLGYTPLGRHPPRQTPPMGRHTPGQTHPRQTPPPTACWDTHPPCQVHDWIDMATAADGRHPTGMHSCYHPQRSWGKVMFLQVSVILSTGVTCMVAGGWGVCVVAGWHAWLPRGTCMVARGAYMVAWRHAWLLGGMHGCQGQHAWLPGGVWLLGGMCGCWGHAWLLGGMHGLGGMCSCGGACMVAGRHA